MNTISIMSLIGLLFLMPYALYIDAMRRGRDSRGKFTKIHKVELRSEKKMNKVKKSELFYSNLRGGVIV